MGDYKTGIVLLEKSLDIFPTVNRRLAIYPLLKSLYLEIGNFQEAKKCEDFLNVIG